jgi:hypothetical protein
MKPVNSHVALNLRSSAACDALFQASLGCQVRATHAVWMRVRVLLHLHSCLGVLLMQCGKDGVPPYKQLSEKLE